MEACLVSWRKRLAIARLSDSRELNDEFGFMENAHWTPTKRTPNARKTPTERTRCLVEIEIFTYS